MSGKKRLQCNLNNSSCFLCVFFLGGGDVCENWQLSLNNTQKNTKTMVFPEKGQRPEASFIYFKNEEIGNC
jgi:hypothetical protein